jgi:hypothetical protein
MYRGVVGVLSAVALSTIPAFAFDSNGSPAGVTFEVAGFVPVICRANFSSNVIPVVDQKASLGTLNEFCNSPAGYQVLVDNSAELAGATLIVDGREVTLAADRPTLVASSEGPASVARDIQLVDANKGGSLSFRVVAR